MARFLDFDVPRAGWFTLLLARLFGRRFGFYSEEEGLYLEGYYWRGARYITRIE